MKALVLAGGAGTRLRPITHTSAKQLVPLANKPILYFGLEAIRDAGITEVGIVVGETATDIRTAVGDGSQFGLNVTYINQDLPRGLAHAVLVSRDFLGDEPFVMYLGDNLVIDGITSFVNAFRHEQPNATVLLTKVDEPQHFGVAELNEKGDIVRLVEKPSEPPSDLALVGVYLFDQNIHEAVRAIQPSARGELEITDAIQWLIENGFRVTKHVLTEPWIDTGKRQDLLEANRIVLENIATSIRGSVDSESRIDGRVIIEDGAIIERSVIRGPAIIGAGAHISGSFIGPYSSIAADCEIKDSELEHSVILEGARITGINRIVDSLVGRHAEVQPSDEQPKAHRFMIGDHSQIWLS